MATDSVHLRMSNKKGKVVVGSPGSLNKVSATNNLASGFADLWTTCNILIHYHINTNTEKN